MKNETIKNINNLRANIPDCCIKVSFEPYIGTLVAQATISTKDGAIIASFAKYIAPSLLDEANHVANEALEEAVNLCGNLICATDESYVATEGDDDATVAPMKPKNTKRGRKRKEVIVSEKNPEDAELSVTAEDNDTSTRLLEEKLDEIPGENNDQDIVSSTENVESTTVSDSEAEKENSVTGSADEESSSMTNVDNSTALNDALNTIISFVDETAAAKVKVLDFKGKKMEELARRKPTLVNHIARTTNASFCAPEVVAAAKIIAPTLKK